MPRAKYFLAFSIVFLFGALTPYLAQTAEEKPREIPALKTAYLDMGKLFVECKSYKATIDKMKAETPEIEAKFKADYEEMKNMANLLKELPRSSDDYRRLQTQLETKDAALKQRQAEARKDFETRITDVQFKLHQQIEKISRKLCAQHGVGILLRANTTSVDAKDPAQVLRAINNTIVVADPRLDLTDEVLAELNKNLTMDTPAIDQ